MDSKTGCDTSRPVRSSKFEGAHAKPRTLAQDPVDLAEIGYALGDNAQRLGAVAAAGVVDDEPRRILCAHGLVSHAPGERGQRIADPGRRHDPVDHLDDLHQRHRIEKMIAGYALRVLAAAGDRGDLQRGRVGCKDARLGHDRFELREQFALGLQVLDDGLDHQMATG